MLSEANARVGEARREAHRFIGDFTLFWTGLYPEILEVRLTKSRFDKFVDYREQGKLAYSIAAEIPEADRRAMTVLASASTASPRRSGLRYTCRKDTDASARYEAA